MSEAAEGYDVEILDASGAVDPHVLLAGLAHRHLHGRRHRRRFPSGLPTPFRFTVYQLSTVFGRGGKDRGGARRPASIS